MSYFVHLLVGIKIIIFFLAIIFTCRLVVYANVIVPKISKSITTFSDQCNQRQTLGITRNNETNQTLHTPHSSQPPNIDISFSDSKKIHGYNDNVTACSDFYQKACSLMDDPLALPYKDSSHVGIDDDDTTFDESDYTTGTFQDMIEANNDAIYSIVTSINAFHKCKEFYNDREKAIQKINIYYKNITLSSLFDVWLNGGVSIFKITQRAKVLTESLYSTDFDIDFQLLLNLFEPVLNGRYSAMTWMTIHRSSNEDDISPLEVLKIMAKFYSFFQQSSYPTNLSDYKNYYIKAGDIDVKYKNIRRILFDVLNITNEDTVMFNGQYDFFEQCFKIDKSVQMRKFYSYLLKFQNMLLFYDYESLSYTYDDSLVEITRELLGKNITTKMIKDRNKMWTKMRKFGNKIKLKVEKYKVDNDQIVEKYCVKTVRKVYFNTVNYKYFLLSNSKDHETKIYKLVKEVLEMSQNFFANKTENLNFYGTEEFKLHIQRNIADYFLEKMKFVKIMSLSSVNQDFAERQAKFETNQLSEYSRNWLDIYRYGLYYRKMSIIKIINNVRSKSYISSRENVTLNLEFTWITVKAETVNAWYDPTTNYITIPIGIARYPMFRADKFYDLGFFGSVVGHELGHASDYSGKSFDKYGSWIGDNEDYRFLQGDEHGIESNVKCLIRDYGSACGNDGYGQHTLGEDMADQFGLRMVLFIVNNELYKYNGGPNQFRKEFDLQVKIMLRQVFSNFAGVWCGRATFYQECTNVRNDVHALPQHRVIKTLRQFQSFKNAFECKDTDSMVNTKTCIVY